MDDFRLWIIDNYLTEKWEFITPIGRIFLYPAWFIRSIFMWIISPLFIPLFYLENSEFYKKIKEEIEKNPPVLPFN